MLHNCLSSLAVVAVNQSLGLESSVSEELLNGSCNKNHDRDAVEVSQVEVVDPSPRRPALNQDCSLTENAHDLRALSWINVGQLVADLLRLEIAIETLSTLHVAPMDA